MALRKIVHISDLHFSEKKESLLQNSEYVDKLVESLKDFEGLDTLIISGDIVDQGGNERIYKKVDECLKRFREELGIKYILCVPGNHDVNRNLLRGISGKEGIDTDNLWKYYDEKLEYYWKFVKRNNINQYGNSGLVCFEILSKPNMILLGLDSTDHIGESDAYGVVNVEKLKEAFKSVFGEQKERYVDYVKIAVLHHRPIVYESKSQTYAENNGEQIGQYGTCDPQNWEKIRKILLEYGVHYILTGHVHGTQSGQIRPFELPHDEMIYSTVGSIGVDFGKELNELLDKEISDKQMSVKCYGSFHGNHNAYNIWTIDENGLIREEQYKYVVDEGNGRWCRWDSKDFEEEKEIHESESLFETEVVTDPVINEDSENYEETILEIVRKNDLYKTGHYHWKNSARLNWIDTSFFFQQREMMFYVASGINDLFEKNGVLRDADCIIGLGIKGSILLSYIRFLFPEKKCSYLPENQNEYNCYEMTLFDDDEKIKSIVVLTDVVHSGNTVKNLANEVYKKRGNFLNVNVVTIFDATPNGKIANMGNKAKFFLFSLAKLKVIDCQGGGENCEIYIRKLANVIEYRED